LEIAQKLGLNIILLADAASARKQHYKSMNNQVQPLALSILRTAATNASRQGLFSDAQAIAKRALELAEKLVGTESSEYMSCLQELVERSQEAGDYNTAEQHQLQVIASTRQLFGSTHPATALQLRILAEIMRAIGNQLEARRLEKAAAAILTDFSSRKGRSLSQ
jgi:hypothetical protein